MLFELSWVEDEEFTHYLFEHDSKTEEEFNTDIRVMLQKHAEEFFTHQGGQTIGSSDWLHYIANRMDQLGYSRPNTARVVFSATCILTQNDDVDWVHVVGKELFKKAVMHNENIDPFWKPYPTLLEG